MVKLLLNDHQQIIRNIKATIKAALQEIYKTAIDTHSIACAIAFAMEQPSDVAINEMIIRPNVQIA
ncbi:MAG: hypothetical protein WKF89_11035 [Chitinophagaceae bacterium]